MLKKQKTEQSEKTDKSETTEKHKTTTKVRQIIKRQKQNQCLLVKPFPPVCPRRPGLAATTSDRCKPCLTPRPTKTFELDACLKKQTKQFWQMLLSEKGGALCSLPFCP